MLVHWLRASLRRQIGVLTRASRLSRRPGDLGRHLLAAGRGRGLKLANQEQVSDVLSRNLVPLYVSMVSSAQHGD